MRLLINFKPAEGAIIRILGLIERRGFMLTDVEVRDEGTDGSIMVDLASRDPARKLDVLARQIARLVEVKGVSIPTPLAGPYS